MQSFKVSRRKFLRCRQIEGRLERTAPSYIIGEDAAPRLDTTWGRMYYSGCFARLCLLQNVKCQHSRYYWLSSLSYESCRVVTSKYCTISFTIWNFACIIYTWQYLGYMFFFSFWDWIELFFFRMKKAPFVFLMLSKQSWLCYAFKITCHLVRFHSLIYSLRRSSSSASSTHCRGRRKRDKTNCIVACYPIPDKVLFYEQMENCSGSIAS